MIITACLCVCGCLTEATAIARHDHERAQASSDDALRPSQRWFFEGACVLVEEGVDTVGRRRTTIPHHGLCGSQHFSLEKTFICILMHCALWLTNHMSLPNTELV